MARKVRTQITVNPQTSAEFGHKVTDRLASAATNGVASAVGLLAGAVWGIATGVGKVAGAALEQMNIAGEDEAEAPTPAGATASTTTTTAQGTTTTVVEETLFTPEDMKKMARDMAHEILAEERAAVAAAAKAAAAKAARK